jgi:SAM-dependent methyltransferase
VKAFRRWFDPNPVSDKWKQDRLDAAHIAANGPAVDYKLYHANIAASHINVINKRVLVVGCNRGEDCKIFIDLGAHFVTGLDVMDEIGENFAHPRVRYTAASAEEMPFDDDVFDLVFAYATLEHVPNISSAFKEMARVCLPNGIIYSAAAPLWNSRQGPHWGNGFADMPWLHLRKTPAEIQEHNIRLGSAIAPEQISYWLDDRFFNKRWAREYLAAGWSVPRVEILSNELQLESESVLSSEIFEELAEKGYSKMELLALTHVFTARRL